MGKQFRVTVNDNVYNVNVEEVRGFVSAPAPVSNVTNVPSQVLEPVAKQPEPVIQEQPKATNTATDTVKVKAPMPGGIWKILKHEGDKVKKDETLLILEVMKMENEIVAPADGEIKRVAVAEGQRVEVGQILVELA